MEVGEEMKMDRSLPIFLAIGVGNTLLNWVLMLVLYTNMGLGFWPSSAIGYVVTSALSFILNRKYSFQSKGNVWIDLARFVAVIGLCYFVANAMAKPLIEWVLRWDVLSVLQKWSGQIALLFGNVVFTALNYVGQRLFAFKDR